MAPQVEGGKQTSRNPTEKMLLSEATSHFSAGGGCEASPSASSWPYLTGTHLRGGPNWSGTVGSNAAETGSRLRQLPAIAPFCIDIPVCCLKHISELDKFDTFFGDAVPSVSFE